jgi:aspartyl-tRNA(Asn)/glutamyl-tRNA(Gln) amidotransferase subunit C
MQMSNPVSTDDVFYVASLAKIAITDAEAGELTKDLDAILTYVRQLDEVDTEGLEPTYQVTGLKNVMREDEEIDYDVDTSGLLQNAPDQQDNQIKVPKVL